MNHPAQRSSASRGDDSSTATRERADRLQAEYFLRLLSQNRRLIDDRIAEYNKAIAAADAAGDAATARTFRRMTLGEEGDRHDLDGMIDELLRRFPRPSVRDAPPIARRVRLAAR